MKSIITTDEAHAAIAGALENLEEQRNRTLALVSAVRDRLSKEGGFFSEVQLLDMAEEMLGDICDVQTLKTRLGVAL